MIKMFDPTIDYKNHKEEYNNSIQTVLNHGHFIMGPEVLKLENKLASYCNTKNCITVSNGTDALMISLMSLGICPGDEVITVPFTWIATAEIICILGGIPIFVDIDSETYNMDINKLEEKITSKTKAIIPVSLYGQIADLEGINKIAEKYSIPIIEDAAQSFGAKRNDYNSCGCKLSMYKIGCTSFFPSKPLGCYGDGGAIFTDDDKLANKIKAIRTHGGTERFKHEYIGTNGRMNTLQAGILLTKIKYFDDSLKKRNQNCQYYNQLFKNHPIIKIPYVDKNNIHIYAQYTILLDTKERRDKLKDYLKKNSIESAIFYPIAIHTQKAFNKFGYKEGDFPISENICNRVLSIPCYPDLSENDIYDIGNKIKNYII